jgi:hypothetical protein
MLLERPLEYIGKLVIDRVTIAGRNVAVRLMDGTAYSTEDGTLEREFGFEAMNDPEPLTPFMAKIRLYARTPRGTLPIGDEVLRVPPGWSPDTER